MSTSINAVRGMNDYLPTDTPLWDKVEKILKNVLLAYGYKEIRLPLLEHTKLFYNSIGKITDIVEKEMYNFNDRKGNSLTLRPEGTTGCVRAGIEHGLLYNQEQRLWYIGPMFRYERPQKWRYRQFHQLGGEVFGQSKPNIDVEIILLTARLWRLLGINECLSLELNSIGSVNERIHYKTALVSFLKKHSNILDEDCRRRLHTNPMRILDSKNPNIQNLLNDAPMMIDYLGDASYNHFKNLCHLLDMVNIKYTINKRLVRGLDYYNKTVFEWVNNSLLSRNSICGGGRYDNLVSYLGGHPTPAVGFAIGLERLILLIKEINPNFMMFSYIDIYLIVLGNNVESIALILAEQLRTEFPYLKLLTNLDGINIKKQLHYAYKYNARIVLVLDETIVQNKQIIVKDLMTKKQETCSMHEVVAKITTILK